MAIEALEVRSIAPTSSEVDLVRKIIASENATEMELKLYLYDCKRQGVHPLDKLLHFVKRGGKYTPITSIDLFRSRAAETGEYAGSDDAVFVENKNGHPDKATVVVYRFVQNTRVAFGATAYWDEYVPDGYAKSWEKMSHVMLAKCAEALALRKGFPQQLAGLYTKEEMDQARTPDEAEDAVQVEVVRPPKKPNGALEPATAPPTQDSSLLEDETPTDFHFDEGSAFEEPEEEPVAEKPAAQNSRSTLDPAKKFCLIDGEPHVAFGKHGRPPTIFADVPKDYFKWMLGSDFPEPTKDVIRQYFPDGLDS